MDSQNILKSLKHQSSNNSRQDLQVSNQTFKQVAGFDGHGGYHGGGGHGGNQVGINEPNQQAEIAQFNKMKRHYDSMKYLDQAVHPVSNQAHLSDQAYSQNQDFLHSNREQRAMNYFHHKPQPSGGGSSNYRQRKLNLVDQLLQEEFDPQSLQPLQLSRKSKHQRYQTVDPQEKWYPKVKESPFKKQQIDDVPAGYGNYGPQMLSQEQTVGERPVIDFRGRKSSKANDLKLPSLTTEENWVEPIETIFKPKSTRVTFLPPRENMFSPKGEDHPKFNAVVEQLITGEKAPVQNPKNQHHIQLTSNSNKKTRLNETSEKTLNSPSIFKQQPIWGKSNEKSNVTNKMYDELKKDIKHLDMEATQVTVDDPFGKKTILQRLASPFTRVSNFDAVGTIKTVEGGNYNIIPQEVVTPMKLKSKTVRDQAYQNNTSASLKQTLNTIYDGDIFINDANAKTVTPFMSKKHNSALPEDISKDISQIHMYDTLILGKEPSPSKPRNRTTIRRNLREKISRPKNTSIDIYSVMPKAELFGSSRTPTNKITMRAINTGQLSPRAQQLVTDVSEHDHSELGSSSAFSQSTQTLMIGTQKVKTIKGVKINQQSPITKRMNELAINAIDQIDFLQKKIEKQKNLRDTLWLKAQGKKMKEESIEDSILGEPLPETAKGVLDQNQQNIQILKNDLKRVVAPEGEQYIVFEGDSKEFLTVDCLPNMIPIYLQLSASEMKSPMQFEIRMGNVNALQVLISNEHKLPKEEDQQFEKEQLIFRDILLNKDFKMSQQKKQQKNSILVIKASAAFENQHPKSEAIIKKLADHNAAEGVKKRLFTFAKANFEETFDKDEFIYVALMSQNGGQIKIKAGFPNDYGNYGPVDMIELYDKIGTETVVEEVQPQQIVNELQNWYQENLKFMEGYKYIFEARANFTEVNKKETLENCQQENALAIHKQKMIENKERREKAASKAIDIYEAKYYKNLKNLSKWEDYRENKIELTHIFIKVMKRKNFLRRWLIIHKRGQIFFHFSNNLFIRRELNRIQYASYFVALRFKNTYLFRFQRQYGFDWTQRRRNTLRRAFNFAAQLKLGFIEKDTNDYLASFIFKTFLIFNTSQQFTKFNDNLIFVQEERRNIALDRENRFEMVYQRLADYKEFFVSPVCYGAKKAKFKKGAPKKIKENLKKMFPKKKRLEETVKLIRSQLDIREKIHVLENQAILWSIKAREITIVKLLLKDVKVKDENKESIHKDAIENCIEEAQSIIKKIKKIYDKTQYKHEKGSSKSQIKTLEFSELDLLERSLFGITNKEIKDVNSQIKKYERSMPKHMFEIKAANKFSPVQVMKDDKAIIEKYKKEIPKIKAARVEEKKRIKELLLKGGDMEEDEGDQDDDGEEGAEGEMDGEMEGDMEGLDNQLNEEMDGVEGMEGMEGMEGEMENAEDMGGEMENAEDMEGDMDAMDGEMDNAEGMEGEDGMDEMGGEEATLANDASAADLGTGETVKSPKKSKKKGSPSKTVKKKVKDPNEIKVLEYKKSDKTKRWVVNEKSLDVPEDIQEYIKQKYPKIEPVEPQEPLKEGEKPKKQRHGVNLMSEAEIKELVHEMYYKSEKKKLKAFTLKKKYKFTETALQKIILHIALNFEITLVNKDIENAVNAEILPPAENKPKPEGAQTAVNGETKLVNGETIVVNGETKVVAEVEIDPLQLIKDGFKPVEKPEELKSKDDLIAEMVINIFDTYDKDKSGIIDRKEAIYVVNSMREANGQQPATYKQFNKEFSAIDKNGDGTLDKEEMILAVRRLLDNKDKNEKGVIKIVSDMWKDFDTDGNGKLNRLETFKFVNHFFKSQGKPEATNAAFDQLFKKFDANGDGFISKQEMSNFVTSFTRQIKEEVTKDMSLKIKGLIMASEEIQRNLVDTSPERVKESDSEFSPSPLPQEKQKKPLQMQPCLKKKSSGTGSQGDKKSHGSQKPTTPPELKVDGSAKDPNENLPDNVQVKLDEGKDK